MIALMLRTFYLLFRTGRGHVLKVDALFHSWFLFYVGFYLKFSNCCDSIMAYENYIIASDINRKEKEKSFPLSHLILSYPLATQLQTSSIVLEEYFQIQFISLVVMSQTKMGI